MKDALLRLLVIGCTFLGAGVATYVVPGLEDYRPWIDGEPVPFESWWGGGGSVDGTRLGPPGAQTALAAPEAVAAETGLSMETIAEARVGEDEPVEGDDEVLAPPPEVVVASPKAAAHPPGGDAKPAAPAALTVPEAEYKGHSGVIEDPSGKALDHFFTTLSKTARREPGAVTRVSHWGASVIGADGMTSYVRKKLQAHFGGAGRGWVNVARGWEWYRQKDVVYKSSGWQSRRVTDDSLKTGRYGFGGVAALGYGGASASYEVHADALELYFLAQPKGGDVAITVDGGPEQLVTTKAPAAQDAWHVVKATGAPPHKFALRAKGPVHLYGVTLESVGPGIIYDCVALIGTRADRLLNYDAAHLKAQIAHRKPDLLIIDFGGNELGDKGMALKPYEDRYREVIKNLRAGRPEASCLVMSPIDHGEFKRGKLVTYSLLRRMVPVQKRLAAEMGCGFYDVFNAMGGIGSINGWYKAKLAYSDSHLTPAGDRALGSLVYKALMKTYADWLAKTSR